MEPEKQDPFTFKGTSLFKAGSSIYLAEVIKIKEKNYKGFGEKTFPSSFICFFNQVSLVTNTGSLASHDNDGCPIFDVRHGSTCLLTSRTQPNSLSLAVGQLWHLPAFFFFTVHYNWLLLAVGQLWHLPVCVFLFFCFLTAHFNRLLLAVGQLWHLPVFFFVFCFLNSTLQQAVVSCWPAVTPASVFCLFF